MCLLAAHLLQCRSRLCLIFTFVFLYILIRAATVSLGRFLAISICSIFPLCMESNALEKSTNNIVAFKFLHEHSLEFDV